MSSLRLALRYLTFPLLVGGAAVGSIVALEAGVASEVVVAVVALSSALCVALLERINPYLPEYNHSHGDLRTDLFHNLVSGIALPEVVRAGSLASLHAAGVWLSGSIGMALWPSQQPLALQLGLALLVAELGSYWFHRLEHTSPLWWRIHATHHSAPRLYWLNGGRFHPLDAVLSYAVAFFPLILLGAPEEALALTVAFISAHGLLQHSNIDMRIGPLNWIFANAELHRWHHSPDMQQANHNYGVVLIVWDWLFGTRLLPSDRKPPRDVGIGTMRDFPAGYWAQLASPFVWSKLEAESLAAKTITAPR